MTVAIGVAGARPAAAAAADARRDVARAVALHAVTWLVVTGAAGTLLAALLLVPGAGRFLAPIGYGRWAAVHLDVALYGWLAMPWVGVLLQAFRVDRRPALARLALGAWSAALAAGVVAWLGGATGGKLFLDWSGQTAVLFAVAQWIVAAVLAFALAADALEARPARSILRGASRRELALATLLLVLAAVPAMLLWAADGRRYPAIDPSSGGPTGTSLLGSSLGMIALLVGLPRLLGLRARTGRSGGWALAALAAHLLIFLVLDHGDRSNHEPAEWAALGSLLIWAWLLPREIGRFEWPAATRSWLRAMLAWGALLLVTGIAQFAPPLLDRLKFTHALVAHAHLAMAGFASALAVLLLEAMLGRDGAPTAFGDRRMFWMWHGATVLHLLALAAIGTLEAADPAAFLRGGRAIDALLALRLTAGGGMLAAALGWWRRLAGDSA